MEECESCEGCDCKRRNLKNWKTLLSDIASGIKSLQYSSKVGRVGAIVVTFLVPGVYPGFEFGLVEALDTISNDLFWDERGDWSAATRAKVEVI